MQLIDTIVLVGALNTESEHHNKAGKYLSLVGDEEGETLIPLSTLTEFDLVMKGRNYTFNQRRDAFDWLSIFIPETRVLPSSVTSLKIAAGLEETGMSYFDSLISAVAMEKDAVVLTSDEAISKIVKTRW